MSKNDKRLLRVKIVQEFVELCQALECKSNYASLVLSQIEYWSQRVIEMDSEVLKKIEAAEKFGDELSAMEIRESRLRDGWYFKSAQELSDELMIGVSRATVERCMSEFNEAGLLFKRTSKFNKKNNVNDIKLNIPLLRYLLYRLGYVLEKYPMWSEDTPIEVSTEVEKKITNYLDQLKKAEEEKAKKAEEKKARNEARKLAKKSNPQPAHDEQPKKELAHGEQPNILPAHGEQPKNLLAHGEQPNIGLPAHGEQPYTEITSFTENTLKDSYITKDTKNTFEEEDLPFGQVGVNRFTIRFLKDDMNYDERLIEQIKKEMLANGIDSFYEPEMIDQHRFMVDKNKKAKKPEERVRDWAPFFVEGILRKRPNKNHSFVEYKEKKQAKEKAEKKKTPKKSSNEVPFWNWLEQ